MSFVQTDEIKIYYREYGAGEPLLFIAGAGMDSRGWKFQADEFSKTYRVIVFDNRGSGRSDAPKHPYSIAMLAQDTKNLMDALDIGSAHLVGLSMGGMIAQEFAITFPDRVRSLVIAASTSNGQSIQRNFIEAVNRWVKNDVNMETRIEELLPLQFTKKLLSNHETYKAFKELMLNDKFPQSLYALSQQVDAALNFDSLGRLEKIKAPTLVVVGDEDINTPIALSEQLNKQIPNSQLCIIGGSHGFNIENAAMFNNAIIEFLNNLERP